MTSTKEELSQLSKTLYKMGLSPATSGNVSFKQENSILVSPSGFCLGHVEPEHIVTTTLEGDKLGSGINPSSERFMHVEIYKKRPDVKCIIHVHPPMITAFAVAQIPLETTAMAESVIFVGDVPVVEYATPSSNELAKKVAQAFEKNDCALMANHGVVVCGKSIKDAFHRIETLQAVAETILWANVLGRVTKVNNTQKQELLDIKQKLGL